jgi:hypothetical protein
MVEQLVWTNIPKGNNNIKSGQKINVNPKALENHSKQNPEGKLLWGDEL